MAVTAPVRLPRLGRGGRCPHRAPRHPAGEASEEKDHSALFPTGRGWASTKRGQRGPPRGRFIVLPFTARRYTQQLGAQDAGQLGQGGRSRGDSAPLAALDGMLLPARRASSMRVAAVSLPAAPDAHPSRRKVNITWSLGASVLPATV
jgi:hypothetical protein